MVAVTYNRINYGIHSICPYRISSGLPYGILKVIGGGTMTLTSEFEELFGGSNKFAWAVEAKTISTEWTANVKSMPDFLFEVFMGASVATTAASSTGTTDGFANVLGTSLLDATTGIATATIKTSSEADLGDGFYVVKAVSATTVDVYALSDLEALNGADWAYQDATLKITVSALTITAASASEVPGTGIELTGGSGTIALVTGDTAIFQVRSIHDGYSTITIGASGTTFPEHSQLCVGQKRANGDTFELELKKVVGSGFPIPFEEQTFSIPELAMKLIYDSDNDQVATLRAKKAV